jgi:hypothetical protein
MNEPRKCPVCGEIMIHTDLTDMDRCNNPTCGDMHVLIPPNYQTYADRLAARVAELEMENRAMLFRQKESGGSCFPPNSLEKQLELTEIHNESLKKQSEELFDRIEDVAAELAAAKEEIRQLKMSLGVLEMKEKVKGL